MAEEHDVEKVVRTRLRSLRTTLGYSLSAAAGDAHLGRGSKTFASST